MHVHKPIHIFRQWVVKVSESKSPLSPVIERLEFSTREEAYQAYRQIQKERGKGL